MNNSGLAAVHAATQSAPAHQPTAGSAVPTSPQKETSMADNENGGNKPAAEKETLTLASFKANYPDIAKAHAEESATAERTRILGIEKNALPGHAELINTMKADPTKTPADAAMAVLQAEKASRGAQLTGLENDEGKVRNLRSESTANDAVPTASQGSEAPEGEAKWKADYAASQKLRAEFPTEADYIGFKGAQARGGVKIFAPKAA
jgi:hypothetical protein